VSYGLGVADLLLPGELPRVRDGPQRGGRRTLSVVKSTAWRVARTPERQVGTVEHSNRGFGAIQKSRATAGLGQKRQKGWRGSVYDFILSGTLPLWNSGHRLRLCVKFAR